ncbi:MAG TPA: hypothetical protein VI756_14730 [Blastocatellia bacterium]
MKNDNYLWDRTGEPDADVADLEKRLSVFKYREQSFQPKVDVLPRPARSVNWMAIAAAFAGAAILAVGLWLALNRGARHRGQHDALQADRKSSTAPNQKADAKPSSTTSPDIAERSDSGPIHTMPSAAALNKPRHRSVRLASIRTPAENANRSESQMEEALTNAVAVQVPNPPLIDPETARHIERAQTLLVSFKNSSSIDGRVSSEISEDRTRCRAILSSNIVLRKNAEQRGNLPIQELLGNLEPFLLDIANLPDRPSAADVRDIQNRIKKNEILVALEVYSPPALDGAF